MGVSFWVVLVRTALRDRMRAMPRSAAGETRTVVGRGPFKVMVVEARLASTIGPLDSQTHPRDAVSRADETSVSEHPESRLMPDFGYTLGVYIIRALSYSQRHHR
jgi:hypothetical protein